MTLSTAARNAAVAAIAALLDSGNVLFHTSGENVVVETTLEATAFTSSGDGTMAAEGVPIVTVVTAEGTIAHAHLRSSGDDVIIDATVGVTDEDFVLSDLTYGTGSSLSLNSLTLEVLAS